MKVFSILWPTHKSQSLSAEYLVIRNNSQSLSNHNVSSPKYRYFYFWIRRQLFAIRFLYRRNFIGQTDFIIIRQRKKLMPQTKELRMQKQKEWSKAKKNPMRHEINKLAAGRKIDNEYFLKKRQKQTIPIFVIEKCASDFYFAHRYSTIWICNSMTVPKMELVPTKHRMSPVFMNFWAHSTNIQMPFDRAIALRRFIKFHNRVERYGRLVDCVCPAPLNHFV